MKIAATAMLICGALLAGCAHVPQIDWNTDAKSVLGQGKWGKIDGAPIGPAVPKAQLCQGETIAFVFHDDEIEMQVWRPRKTKKRTPRIVASETFGDMRVKKTAKALDVLDIRFFTDATAETPELALQYDPATELLFRPAAADKTDQFWTPCA